MLDPALILTAEGLALDPWQHDLLLSTDNSILLCCSRQAGKSTTVAALAVHTTEVNAGERSDVSWISTETPDRVNEVVIAKGMNDSQFTANPLVTLQHAYWCPPVGKSLWRKRIKDGPVAGIKAKTVYPPRPDSWPLDESGQPSPWPPDKVLSLIQAGMLQGKSIGFQVLKGHHPDSKECQKNGWDPDRVCYVIDEWLLLEYAVCYLPCNPDTLVEAVSKGSVYLPPEMTHALGIDPTLLAMRDRDLTPAGGTPSKLSFTPLTEIEKAVTAAIAAVDFERMAKRAAEEAWQRSRGRI